MRRLIIAATTLLIAPSAFAQSNSELADRLQRMERDMNFLQKQVYTTGAPVGDPNALPLNTGAGAAQVDVRFSQMEEQMRALRGEIERANYAATQAQASLEKLKQDYDYRLQALEQAQNNAAASAAAAPSADAEASAAPTSEASVSDAPASYQPASAEPAKTGADFPDANAAYNTAFRKLNAKDYSGAAAEFDQFVKKYPNDPLTSNAYYWLGESYYARGDYTRAVDSFQKGFKTNPDAQKAPDNLLKLAMSLDRVKRNKEGCIVLKQLVSKYGDKAPSTRTRAEAEQSRMQCK